MRNSLPRLLFVVVAARVLFSSVRCPAANRGGGDGDPSFRGPRRGPEAGPQIHALARAQGDEPGQPDPRLLEVLAGRVSFPVR